MIAVVHIEKGCVPTQIGVCGVGIFTNFCFFIHNVGCRYARKLFKGSKDADFCLVSEKNLSQKNESMGWGPGPGKGGQKNEKTLPLDILPINRQTKIFFLMSTRRLAESLEGLNSSLALAAGDLWPKKGEPIYWLAQSLTLLEPPGFGDFRKKNSSFPLPYQRPCSSAHCARELFSGSNGSASLVDCTRKKILFCFF